MAAEKSRTNWDELKDCVNRYKWAAANPAINLCMTCANASVQIIACAENAQTPPALACSIGDDAICKSLGQGALRKIICHCQKTIAFVGAPVQYCDRHEYDASSESENGYLKGIFPLETGTASFLQKPANAYAKSPISLAASNTIKSIRPGSLLSGGLPFFRN